MFATQNQFPVIELPEYSSALYARRHSGIFVRRAAVSIGTWRPSPNHCHANADEWCRYMHDYVPVRGWLYFEFENALPHVIFNAHSVVQDVSGQLLDITPSVASQRYPFILSAEPEDAYFRLVDQGVSRIRHVKPGA